jgi:DNA polymerase III sliding clamp (beta) subunit (PCNA family)
MNAITITHQELKDLLTPVLPHVDQTGMMPILGCVSFETRAGYLTATATDRYTIAITRMKVEPETEFKALIQANECKSLLAMFKPSKLHGGEALTLTIDGHELRVEGAGALFSSAVIKYNLYEGEYPKITGIFQAAADSTMTAEPFNLNGQLLAKFRLAARPAEPLTFTASAPNRPVFVRSGNHFIGAIMTMRNSSEEPASDWTSIFAETKLAEKAVA